MVRISYENFREVECKYVKYITRLENKFRLRIIDYQEFKNRFVDKFTEDEIKWFFGIFPHVLESEISEVDRVISMKLSIDFYEDLHLIEVNGTEYVLFDESSEYFENWEFPKDITSQPIPFEEFISIAFDDFALGSTLNLIFGIEDNLEDRNDRQKKYVEKNGIINNLYT